MAHYIDKDAVVAEIERRKHKLLDNIIFERDKELVVRTAHQLNRIILFLDTLEVKELPIWEKVSPDTGQTTLYFDGDKSYLERFGYRIDLKDLDKLPKENLKAQKGE